MQRPSTPSVIISDADDIDAVTHEDPKGSSINVQNDLVQASSKNPSILLELDMDGNVSHLSKNWESIVGTSINKILNKSISTIILGSEDDKKVFTDAIRIMITDDASYRVRFVVATNDTKPDNDNENDDNSDEEMVDEDQTSSNDNDSLSSLSTNGEMIELEGQGILIHNKMIPTHSMWILKPFNSNALNVELPLKLAETLGFGADIFASYLTSLSEAGIINEDEVPPPPQVLCRICEQHVPSWWLEKHAELCLNEHKCESDVQILHDSLLDHKTMIQDITESLNKDSLNIPNIDGVNEYKGLPLPNVAPASESPVSRSSTPIRRARSGSIFGNLRFPFKTLALLLELCESAIDINTSEFNEESDTYEFSPNTKDALNHVLTPNIPSSSDPAINLLSSDIEKLVNDKVDAVHRLNSSLLYSKKIKAEVDQLIVMTIAETLKSIRNQNYNIVQSSGTKSGSETDSTLSFRLPPQAQIDDPQSTTLVHPRPTALQSAIFTDAYMDTDSLPSPSVHHLIEKDRFSPSRSITPGEALPRDEIELPKFNELIIRSPLLTPQRRPSPGPTSAISIAGYHNSPMSSIQRNVKHDSGSGTPISSPLILAHDPSDLLDRKGSLINEHLLSVSTSGSFSKAAPLSPLLVAIQPTPSKAVTPSIKDYEILKPISKGAFGSVYLARRKVTGDYFAIKVLKKSDMIAKNQVTNVKAERAIMMAQSDSPYVARLYSSFQSKDYLFLVMEYLPGGDCLTLVKTLLNLPDEWARRYIGQVIVGVEDLHRRGIVHHDLKPDNLLIDSTGHLKLTDFGLSRMGLVRRQERLMSKSSSVPDEAFIQATTSLHHRHRTDSISVLALSGPLSAASDTGSVSSSPTSTYFDNVVKNDGFKTNRSDSQGSAPASPFLKPLHKSSSQTSFVMPEEYQSSSPGSSNINNSKNFALFDPENAAKNKKFVGTPDYLAPETIKGSGENEASDWWSVGCILFEFLFGYPPFHDNSPELVFQNILEGRIDWPNLTPEEELNYCTPVAKDLIKKLLVLDPTQRLGYNGADEIKNHEYFAGLEWDKLYEVESSFVPKIDNPESTEYFESRGATMDHDFSIETSDSDDDNRPSKPELSQLKTKQGNATTSLGSPSSSNSPTQKHLSLALPLHMRERRPSRLNDNTSEFGSFQFRNLPALDKANKDVINRIKAEHLEHRNSISSSSSESGYGRPSRNYSITSPSALKRSSSPSTSMIRGQSPSGRGSFSSGNILHTPTNVAAYSNDDYSQAYFENSGRSSPSTDSGSPSTKAFAKPAIPVTPIVRQKSSRSSKAHLLQRTLSEFSPSSSDTEDSRSSALERVRKRRQSSRISEGPTKLHVLDVLLCEPIPILRFQLKKDLEALNCAVVAVDTRDELVRRATGEVKFDVVITALKSGSFEILDIVKLLKHTSSVNSDTPVIAVTAYYKEAISAGVFSDVLEKPVNKKQLLATLERNCSWKFNVNHEEAVSDSEALSDADLYNGQISTIRQKNSTG